MLQDIDDDIIVNQIGDRKLGLNIHTINFLLKMKYGKDVSVYEYDEDSLYKTIGGHRIYSIRDHGIHVSVVEIRNRNLHIAGYYTDPFEGAGLRLKIYMAGEPIEFVRYESETFKPKYFGSEASKCYEFVCDISLCQYLHGGREEKLYFVLENEHIRHKMAINLNRFPYCKLYPPNKCSYYIKEHIGLSAMNDGLRIKKSRFWNAGGKGDRPLVRFSVRLQTAGQTKIQYQGGSAESVVLDDLSDVSWRLAFYGQG